MVNYQHLDGDVSSYGVNSSQLIGFAKAWSSVEDVRNHGDIYLTGKQI